MEDEEISVGEWCITIIILAIPLVNILYLIIGMFTARKASKRNYLRASLLLPFIAAIVFLVGLFIFSTITGKGFSELMPNQEQGSKIEWKGLQDKIDSLGSAKNADTSDGFITLDKTDGESIQVKVLSIQGSLVNVQQTDGQRVMIGINSLTPNSQNKIREAP